jgi:hypothetical protein
MITLLLSPITSIYCTSLTIRFYSEVVVTIRAHFVLPTVIVIGLDYINQTLLFTCFILRSLCISVNLLSIRPSISPLTLRIPSVLSHDNACYKCAPSHALLTLV